MREIERRPEPFAGDVSLVAALGVVWCYRWITARLSVAALVLMKVQETAVPLLAQQVEQAWLAEARDMLEHVRGLPPGAGAA